MAAATTQPGAITAAAPPGTTVSTTISPLSGTAGAVSAATGGTTSAQNDIAATSTTNANDSGVQAEAEAAEESDEDDDEEDDGHLEAFEILDQIVMKYRFVNEDPNLFMDYETFFDRFWFEFEEACDEVAEKDRFEIVCDEDHFEDYHLSCYWASLSKEFESSYLPDCKPLRYETGDAVDYEKCTPKDLKRFVNERRLPDPYPDGVTLKYFYIRTLETYDRVQHFRAIDYKLHTVLELKRIAAHRGLLGQCWNGAMHPKLSYIRVLGESDRVQQFDFMGLPAEMRMMVYRCLLSVPIPACSPEFDGKPYPSILGTSKTICKEAKDVLYNENVYLADFKVTVDVSGKVNKGATVHRKVANPTCEHGLFLSMPKSIDDYPEFFRRIHHLQINLTYHVETAASVPSKCALVLNNFLYTLASFLMDGHRLRTLRLRVDISDDMPESEYPKIFYPLRRLRNVKKVTIVGKVPATVEKTLQRDLASIEPVFNTMRYWKFIHDEKISQNELIGIVMEACCDCGECVPCRINYKLEECEAQTYTTKSQSCVGSKNEKQFIATLAWYEDALGHFDVIEAQKLVKKIANQRKVFKKYKLATDDGRPKEAKRIWGDEDYQSWDVHPPVFSLEEVDDVEDWPES